MEPWMRDLIPLKSSLSVILSDRWSNTVSGDCDGLGVLAQRLVDLRSKNESACEKEKRTKKSRQVFTFSRPAGYVVDLTGKAEVYESAGREMGLCWMEPHAGNVAKHVGQPRPVRVSAQTSNSEISHPKFVLSQVRSECGLTCLPCARKPSLLYSVSDSSLPILKNSSPLFITSHVDARDSVPVYGSFSSAWFAESNVRCVTQRRSILINRHRDVLVKYTKMDEDLAKKIAEAIQQVKTDRGKFMSYAKFNSKFKLSEVFYEGINSKSVSHASLRTLRLSGLIHKVNPDFDENQSITEALTVLKSLSSVTAESRITRVCRLVSSQDLKAVDWRGIESNVHSCGTSSKIDPRSADTGSSNPVVSAFGKQRLFTLRGSMKSTFTGDRKETDIWSSASTPPKATTPSPKRLVDVVSPSCIFRATLVEAMKRPVWRLKTDKVDRTEQVNDFIFKAHNYMRVRDRPNSHKCFFQPQPSYRVVDESVQFPDVEPSSDRSPNGPRNVGDDVLKDEIREASIALEEPLPDSGAKPKATNVNVLVARDQTFFSMSELHSLDPVGSTGRFKAPNDASSLTLPKSTSSNRCQSSINLTSLTSSQPLRKTVKPVEERPNRRKNKFCRSYPAICDKRKIRIKYENGRYTVLKEKNGPPKQTIWSILRGKATRLLKSVVPRGRHVHRRGR